MMQSSAPLVIASLCACQIGSPVEEHEGSIVRRGAIYMLPGGLVYRLPDGRYALYVFDPIGRVYFVPIDPLDDPNHEPPIDGPRSVVLESS